MPSTEVSLKTGCAQEGFNCIENFCCLRCLYFHHQSDTIFEIMCYFKNLFINFVCFGEETVDPSSLCDQTRLHIWMSATISSYICIAFLPHAFWIASRKAFHIKRNPCPPVLRALVRAFLMRTLEVAGRQGTPFFAWERFCICSVVSADDCHNDQEGGRFQKAVEFHFY